MSFVALNQVQVCVLYSTVFIKPSCTHLFYSFHCVKIKNEKLLAMAPGIKDINSQNCLLNHGENQTSFTRTNLMSHLLKESSLPYSIFVWEERMGTASSCSSFPFGSTSFMIIFIDSRHSSKAS